MRINKVNNKLYVIRNFDTPLNKNHNSQETFLKERIQSTGNCGTETSLTHGHTYQIVLPNFLTPPAFHFPESHYKFSKCFQGSLHVIFIPGYNRKIHVGFKDTFMVRKISWLRNEQFTGMKTYGSHSSNYLTPVL